MIESTGQVPVARTKRGAKREKNSPWFDLPSTSDPRWADWCRPLLLFLSENSPCGWKALQAWAETKELGMYMLRYCIAWLDFHGLVTATTTPPVLWSCREEVREAIQAGRTLRLGRRGSEFKPGLLES